MEEMIGVLKAISDRNRVRILKLLEQRKMCVCELADILGITQPSVSRHLKRLKKAQLIADEQDSLWTNYYLTSSESLYAMSLLKDLKGWLNADKTIAKDIKRSQSIERSKICCKKI